jgi:hypothetical protein
MIAMVLMSSSTSVNRLRMPFVSTSFIARTSLMSRETVTPMGVLWK